MQCLLSDMLQSCMTVPVRVQTLTKCGKTTLHERRERLTPFHPQLTSFFSTRRGPCTRLVTVGANPWCHRISSRARVSGGWVKDTGQTWEPLWMTIPHASQSCQELLKCGCKSEKGCSGRCKCVRAELPCTALINSS